MGFPIRKSTDQRVFAPPRSLSQRITSFIACACQGIHQLPLRHLIVLIANAHLRNPEGIVASALPLRGWLSAIPKELSLQPNPREFSVRAIRRIVAWIKSCAGFDPMSLAQKDQLLEIGSRARLGKPIICKGLSVPCDKSRPFRLMKFEQIFSLRCQTEQAASQESSPQTFIRMTFSDASSLLNTSARSAGSSRTATIPSGLREWWSRTGSNRRHPACKAGALPAELRPLIVSSRCRGDGGPGRT